MYVRMQYGGFKAKRLRVITGQKQGKRWEEVMRKKEGWRGCGCSLSERLLVVVASGKSRGVCSMCGYMFIVQCR